MRQAQWLLPVLAVLAGCDALRAPKVDNPVMGPPPPRVDLSQNSTARQRPAEPAAATRDRTVRPAAFGQNRTDPPAGAEVIATVNGEPIFADEVLQRHSAQLVKARKELSPDEFQRAKRSLLRRDLKGHIEQKLLTQALHSMLQPEQVEKLNAQLDRAFEKKVRTMKEELEVTTRFELERKLQKQGTSLERMRRFFTNREMAKAYLQLKAQPQQTFGRPQLLAYYREHAEDYQVPAKVLWQQIVIHYYRHGGKRQAFRVLDRVIEELHNGADFGAIAQKYSDGPLARKGGQWDWTRKGSLNNSRVEQALFELPVGSISRVIEGDEAFYLVKVNDRRPAHRRPFEEVQDEIKAKLTRQARRQAAERVIDELYDNAVIETIYDSPSSSTQTRGRRAAGRGAGRQ